jgi:hypothetical protein
MVQRRRPPIQRPRPAGPAADYELTGDLLDEYLATRGTSAREVVLTTLGALDVEGYIRAGGLDDDDLTTLRRRLTVAASEAPEIRPNQPRGVR